MTSHTPGPWTLGQGYKTARNHAVCSGPHIIATVIGTGYPIGEGWSPDSEADAHLIAAAPELLECLMAAVSYIEDDSRSPRRREACLSGFRAAIAKAEGR